jgi:hypothetical protein
MQGPHPADKGLAPVSKSVFQSPVASTSLMPRC